MKFFHAVFAISIFLLLTSCEKNITPFVSEQAEASLSNFILKNAHLELSDELIACAAGGQRVLWEDPVFPISVIFYPVDGATNFRYFETASVGVDPDDFSRYSEKKFADVGIFNGYLRRFLRNPVDRDVWGRVVYETPGKLHISNAIRIKLVDKPSQFAPELCQIDLTTATEPRFQWQDGIIPENAIYFHVVSDEFGNLISGTYTYDKHFRFYDLSNVVLNIRDVNPPPTLEPNKKYIFTMLGVSLDNWVNLAMEKEFLTQ